MTALKLSISSALLAAASALSISLPTGCLTAEAGPQQVRPPQRSVPMASDALGINEAVSFPEKLEDRMGIASQTKLSESARATAALGATWTRGHTSAYPSLSYDRWLREGGSWERADNWVRAIQASGLEAGGMISPFPGNKTRRYTQAYEVRDVAGYTAFVKAAVERYDGDGVDDMPGLRRPIHYWEVDNEPDLKTLADVRTQRQDGFASPAAFAKVVITTSSAIKAADPQAIVSAGGIATPHAGYGWRYMQALYAQPGLLAAIDVVSIHSYWEGPDLKHLDTALDRIQQVAPGKEIWLTETSVPSAGKPWASEQWQAAMVPVAYLHALSRGVTKVFWHTLFDPPPQGQGGMHAAFRTNSLYARTQSGGLRLKPSGEAYKALAELLEGVPLDAIEAVPALSGKAWRVGDKWVVWGEGTVTLPVDATQATAFLTGAPVKLSRSGGKVGVAAGSGGGVVVLSR